jgi:hypothetical protein
MNTSQAPSAVTSGTAELTTASRSTHSSILVLDVSVHPLSPSCVDHISRSLCYQFNGTLNWLFSRTKGNKLMVLISLKSQLQAMDSRITQAFVGIAEVKRVRIVK